MTFDELSDAERADLQTYDLAARGIVAGLSKVARDGNAPLLAAFGATRVTPAVAKLTSTAAIPTQSGYSGATPLTAVEMDALQTLLGTLNSLYVANIVLISKCAGVNA